MNVRDELTVAYSLGQSRFEEALELAFQAGKTNQYKLERAYEQAREGSGEFIKAQTMRVKLVNSQEARDALGEIPSVPVYSARELDGIPDDDPRLDFVWVFQVFEAGEWFDAAVLDADIT